MFPFQEARFVGVKAFACQAPVSIHHALNVGFSGFIGGMAEKRVNRRNCSGASAL